MVRPLYQEIATLIGAYLNCKRSGNDEWLGKHEDALDWIARNCLPRGSGIDCGTKIDLDRSTSERIVMTASFHHMDENGYYDGWTEHVITVRASLISGYSIGISGRNRNDVKEYLYQTYRYVLDGTFDNESKRLAL